MRELAIETSMHCSKAINSLNNSSLSAKEFENIFNSLEVYYNSDLPKNREFVSWLGKVLSQNHPYSSNNFSDLVEVVTYYMPGETDFTIESTGISDALDTFCKSGFVGDECKGFLFHTMSKTKFDNLPDWA